MSEATVLPTEPQPLPYDIIKLTPIFTTLENTVNGPSITENGSSMSRHHLKFFNEFTLNGWKEITIKPHFNVQTQYDHGIVIMLYKVLAWVTRHCPG